MSLVGKQLRQIWGVNLRPGDEATPTSFEAVTRERVDQLGKALDRIEIKLNGMLVAVFAAVLAELYRVAVH